MDNRQSQQFSLSYLGSEIDFHTIPKWTDLTPDLTKLFQGHFIKKNEFIEVQATINNVWISTSFLSRLRVLIALFQQTKYLEVQANTEKVKVDVYLGKSTILQHPLDVGGQVVYQYKGNKPYSFNLFVRNQYENLTLKNRLKVDYNQGFTFYHKNLFKYEEWRLGLLGVFNISERKLLKKDFLIGYLKNRFQFYLKGLQSWNKPADNWTDPKEIFSNYIFTGLYNHSQKETYGVEVEANSSNTALNKVNLLLYWKEKEQRVKAKIGTDSVITLFYQRLMSKNTAIAIGFHLPMNRGEDSDQKAKLGFRISVN